MINNQINLTEEKIKKTEELLARLRCIMYRTDYDSLLAEDKELSNFILERNPEYFYMVFEKNDSISKMPKSAFANPIIVGMLTLEEKISCFEKIDPIITVQLLENYCFFEILIKKGVFARLSLEYFKEAYKMFLTRTKLLKSGEYTKLVLEAKKQLESNKEIVEFLVEKNEIIEFFGDAIFENQENIALYIDKIKKIEKISTRVYYMKKFGKYVADIYLSKSDEDKAKMVNVILEEEDEERIVDTLKSFGLIEIFASNEKEAHLAINVIYQFSKVELVLNIVEEIESLAKEKRVQRIQNENIIKAEQKIVCNTFTKEDFKALDTYEKVVLLSKVKKAGNIINYEVLDNTLRCEIMNELKALISRASNSKNILDEIYQEVMKKIEGDVGEKFAKKTCCSELLKKRTSEISKYELISIIRIMIELEAEKISKLNFEEIIAFIAVIIEIGISNFSQKIDVIFEGVEFSKIYAKMANEDASHKKICEQVFTVDSNKLKNLFRYYSEKGYACQNEKEADFVFSVLPDNYIRYLDAKYFTAARQEVVLERVKKSKFLWPMLPAEYIINSFK